LENDVKIYKRK